MSPDHERFSELYPFASYRETSNGDWVVYHDAIDDMLYQGAATVSDIRIREHTANMIKEAESGLFVHDKD